jgi:hypothetical protein
MPGVRFAAVVLLLASGSACEMTAALDRSRYRCAGAEDCPDGGGGGDGDGGADEDEDAAGTEPVILTREAEDYDANTTQGSHPWITDSTSGHSGAGAMLADGTGNDAIVYPDYYTQGSRLDYDVDFEREGTYYVWVRGMAWSGSDTCMPGIDGSGWANAANPSGALGVPVEDPAAWTWGSTDQLSSARVTVHVPSAGTHMVNIWLREDGVILDRILLTTSEDYVPTGTGP